YYLFELNLPAKVQAIRDRQQDCLHPFIRRQLPIQCVNRIARLIINRPGAKSSTPQHIVEQNDSILPHSWQDQLVIILILSFLRIDKGKVKRDTCLELLQNSDRLPKAQLDPVLDACQRPK